MPIYLGDKLISDMVIGGGDTSDATALINDIRKGKTAYIAEGKVTGSLELGSEEKIFQYKTIGGAL